MTMNTDNKIQESSRSLCFVAFQLDNKLFIKTEHMVNAHSKHNSILTSVTMCNMWKI